MIGKMTEKPELETALERVLYRLLSQAPNEVLMDLLRTDFANHAMHGIAFASVMKKVCEERGIAQRTPLTV